ncbi:protein argonaute 1D-like isoform X1 [Magnolia sinica]|uniref:protein argonaute 1D-like isoform X1 n=1 Tax=Magnolia sinica TaxID=86752 RepID=UPI002659D2DA|nr:protein argonaute 1D-like isoform X1 [Magnolia sinica]
MDKLNLVNSVLFTGGWAKTALYYETVQEIFKTVHHNAYHEDPCAKEFGIKISEKLALVEARILPAPWVVTNFAVKSRFCPLGISTVCNSAILPFHIFLRKR